MKTHFTFFIVLLSLIVHAQLEVTILPVKVTGPKAIIPLAITNNLAETVQYTRAICFLMNEQGKMVGQSSKWVIGGTKDRMPLESKNGATFNFVITSPQPFTTTNLTAKVSFTRIVLADGQVADVNKTVKMAIVQ
jgi:hypothetical protein